MRRGRFDLNLKTALHSDAAAQLVSEYGSQKMDGVFAAIGYGKVSARHTLAKLVPSGQLRDKAADGVTSSVKRVLKPGEDRITVRGFDDLMVFRARCCNPIRGEKDRRVYHAGQGASQSTPRRVPTY